MPVRQGVRREAAAEPGLVAPLTGYYVPDPAPGTFYVTTPPGDQVDVAMKDGLSGHITSVHADIESLHRTIGRHDDLALILHQTVAGVELRPA